MTWQTTSRVAGAEHSVLRGFRSIFAIFLPVFFSTLVIATLAWLSWRRLQKRRELKSLTRQQTTLRLSVVSSCSSIADSDESSYVMQVGHKNHWLGKSIWLGWLFAPVLLQTYMLTSLYLYGIYDEREKDFVNYSAMMYILFGLLAAMVLLPPMRHVFLIRCHLADATYVTIEEEDMETEDDEYLRLNRLRNFFKPATKVSVAVVIDEGGFSGQRWFRHKSVTYVWRQRQERFRPATYTAVLSREGLKTETAKSMQFKSQNSIDVDVPSLEESLRMEYKSITYVLLLFCLWLAALEGAFHCACVYALITSVNGIRQALLHVRRQRAHMQDFHRVKQFVDVLRDGGWTSISTEELVPRDVIRPRVGTVPCDSVLLQGRALLNESILTGEPMPVQKLAYKSIEHEAFDPLGKHKAHMLFAGTTLMSIDSLEAPEGPLCVVTATGVMTAKGQIMRMVLFPNAHRFKFNRDLPYSFLLFAALGFASMVLGTEAIYLLFISGSKISREALILRTANAAMDAAFTGFSPFLPFAISVGEYSGASALKSKGITCLAPARLTMAGKLSVAIFDKTGTLTEDEMSLVFLRPGTDEEFAGLVWMEDGLRGWFQPGHEPLWVAGLATCHCLDWLHDQPVGSQIDLLMFAASGWKYSGISEGSKPLFVGSGKRAEVLRILGFDNKRRTSGALVRLTENDDSSLILFVKGSESRMQRLCVVPSNYSEVTRKASVDGFYLLGLACRRLPESKLHWALSAARADLEVHLSFLALMQFRNQVRHDSKQVITELVDAGVHCVMCSGDNVLTAVSVAKEVGILKQNSHVFVGEAKGSRVEWISEDERVESCMAGLFDQDSTELVVSGEAYSLLRRDKEFPDIAFTKIKVFGRMSPDQKFWTVQQYQSMGIIVGMCGDGGNDCVALRGAHVGIALSEAEASVVAPFSAGKLKSIRVVVEILKVGRAVLQTNMSVYNHFVINGLTAVTVDCFQWRYFNAMATEMQVLTRRIFIPCIYMWAIANCCHEARVLAPHRPSSSIFGIRQLSNIIMPHLVFVLILQVVCLLVKFQYFQEAGYTHMQEYRFWLEPDLFRRTSWYRLGDCTAVSSLFLLGTLHNITVSFLQCCDKEFRRPAYRSWHMIFITIMCLSGCFIMLYTGPNTYTCIFRVNCANSFTKKSNFVLSMATLLLQNDLDTCFWAPSGDKWMHPQSYPELMGARPYNISSSTDGQRCAPPLGSGLPEGIVIDPGNVFASSWKVLFSILIFTLLSVHVVYFRLLEDRFVALARRWYRQRSG